MKRVAAIVLLVGCHSARPAATPAAPAPAVAQPEHARGRADVVGPAVQPLAELVVSGRPCGPAPLADPRPLPMPAPRDPIVFVGKQIDRCGRNLPR